MEDDEETKNVFEQGVNGEIMEEKRLETLEVTDTEQCEVVPETVPELGDAPLIESKSAVEAKDDELVAEEVSAVGAEAEEMSFPELDDLPVVVAKSPIAAEDVEVVAGISSAETVEVGDKMPKAVTEVISTAGTEMEMNAEAERLESGLGKCTPGVDDLQLVGVNSPVVTGDGGEVAEGDILMAGTEMEVKYEVANSQVAAGDIDDAAADGEILKADTEMEVKCEMVNSEDAGDGGPVAGEEFLMSATETEMKPEVEGVEGSVSKTVTGFDESELVGVKSPVAGEEVAEEIPRVGTEMELENEVEAIESSVGKFVSELDDSQLLGTGSFAAKEGGNDEVMEMEEARMDDAEMESENEEASEVGMSSVAQLDNLQSVGAESPIVTRDDGDEDEEVEAEEETPTADTELETEMEVAEMAEAEKVVGGGGKRKRGRNSGVLARAPSRRVIEEDVCFICFDGGDLVLCDRRGCPKAYHPYCVNRDEAFFRAKGRWNCGWHLCSICEKNAYYMCCTCTFSLCKTCIKDAVILCVRGNKGFCETCMRTVMLIENNEKADKENRVDFDDKSSWEYLFKDYWTDLKAKLSLSSLDLAQAKNPWKGSDVLPGKQESPEEVFDANKDQGTGSESSETREASKPKRRKSTRRSKSLLKDEHLPSSSVTIGAEETPRPGPTEWASKELLEFVMHMKNGEKSVLSQFDVQALLLEYIKTNKLRDPRRKSQIICDTRLENLFGKARVGHFEMLKLLESHFLVKEGSPADDIQGTVVDTEANQLEADGTIDAPIKGSKDKKRKMRKKGDERRPQSNLDDYAAIDMHNISLIYLRRKLVEDLLEDNGKFHEKVLDTFVRIRISGSNQKQDMYRLVKVVGTRKAAEPYKVGKKTTDLVLEILNLNKMEVVSIDTISNQEFTEDECKRLRQSIKFGLINRLNVGDILNKAMEVQAARVSDWLETEIQRLSHLRDRASDLGRRKELRECVEKLQLLKTPEERLRRLEEIPKIHADPNMHPDYVSEEHDSEIEEDKQETSPRPRGSGFSRKGRDPISPRRGSFASPDSWSGTKKDSGKNWEINRNISNKEFPNKAEEAIVGERANENEWNQGRDKEASNTEKVNSETVGRNHHSFLRSESFSGATSETPQASLAPGSETATKINETEKMWHYKDPSAKVQGPFSLVQLRKWNNTGYFPTDLRIWSSTEKQDDSILLTDALAGRFQKELPSMDNNFTKSQTVDSQRVSSTPAGKPYGASLQEGNGGQGGERMRFDQNHGMQSQLQLSSSSGWVTPSVEVPKVPEYTRNDSLNLPSPTPMSIGQKNSPAAAVSGSGQLIHSSTSSLVNESGGKEYISLESLGVSRNSLTSYGPVPNSEQGLLVGHTTALPISQTTMSSESQQSVGTQGWGSGSVQNQEMAVPSQIAGSDSQAWGGASSQQLEPNPSLPVPVQPAAAYGHWSAIPATVQNPAGNFSTAGFQALGQSDPWRPPVAGNQPNMQQPPPTVPWGMTTPQSNASAPNNVWAPVQGNPNMGWVGPVPGTTNMNWAPAVQVPVNPGWVAPTGNPGTMFQAMPPGNANLGWVAQPANPGSTVQGPTPGNGNPGWVAPTGNLGFNQGQAPGNVNSVWGPPTGNPGTTVPGQAPGNANAGWGPTPAGNPGTTVQGAAPGNANAGWGGKQHTGDNRFSGQRDGGFQGRDSGGFGGGGRRWNNNRPPSSGGGGGQVCKFHQYGHCRKGASCDKLHT